MNNSGNTRNISVIGLGYVGISIAIEFAKKYSILGFDIDKTRIEELKKGFDRNKEASAQELNAANIEYTHDPMDLKKSDFFIISVPTPIDSTKRPDFTMLTRATEMLAKHLKKGDILVFESSVYPGATEELFIPILEKGSHLKCGQDFGVGYSPERINPGDKTHTLPNVIKIVSADNPKTLEIVCQVYEAIVKAGLYKASSIRVAEAAKIIENTQRDLNISLINEVALICHTLGMNVTEVLDAAKTKWNFLPFQPGLVGGHCVGVNSYYLTHKSEEAGYYPSLIHAGRRINDLIPKFIARETIKTLIHQNLTIKNAKMGVLGITYKEDCADPRDSKVMTLIEELRSFGTQVIVHDPIADPAFVKREYGITLTDWDQLKDVDAIILAVAHRFYVNQHKNDFIEKFKNTGNPKKQGLIVDVKGVLDPEEYRDTDVTLWRI